MGCYFVKTRKDVQEINGLKTNTKHIRRDTWNAIIVPLNFISGTKYDKKARQKSGCFIFGNRNGIGYDLLRYRPLIAQGILRWIEVGDG